MISYKQDPLLKNKSIYACLVKEKDLKYKNFNLRTPTISIVNKNRLIKLMKRNYEDINKAFLDFTKKLELYLGIKYTSLYKTKYRYLKNFRNNKINMVFLRVISIRLSNSLKESEKLLNEFSMNNSRYIQIKNLKLKINGFNNRTIYLIGVIAGDGHLDKRETELMIADGQSNKNKLKLSREYIKLIKVLFKKEFNIKGNINKIKNYWEYRLGSKWICRFINHYFKIPFGKKTDIVQIPENLSNSNEKYFWRGLMDTDGYIREGIKQISLKSNSIKIIKQFNNFCRKKGIYTNIRKEKNGWEMTILTTSFLTYAKSIGFSHPRKKQILIKHLKEGPKYKILKKSRNSYFNLFKFLKPYQNNVYISFSEHNQKTNKKTVKKLLNEISKTFNVKITKINRDRYNNHYYICSKEFTNFVKNNTIYDLPWKPLNKEEINKLSKEWIL